MRKDGWRTHFGVMVISERARKNSQVHHERLAVQSARFAPVRRAAGAARTGRRTSIWSPARSSCPPKYMRFWDCRPISHSTWSDSGKPCIPMIANAYGRSDVPPSVPKAPANARSNIGYPARWHSALGECGHESLLRRGRRGAPDGPRHRGRSFPVEQPRQENMPRTSPFRG